jgi:hypothetical protein
MGELAPLYQENVAWYKSKRPDATDEEIAQYFKGREQYWQEAFPYLQQALGDIEGGYNKGLAEVYGIGQEARQRTLDREKGLIGASRQALQSRGLGSTTVGANLERGISYDTNLALGQIDDQLAQLRSGLQVGKGSAMAGARGNLFQALMGRAQQRYDYRTDLANVGLGMASNLASADQAMSSMLVKGAAMGIGAAAGGPGGAAAMGGLFGGGKEASFQKDLSALTDRANTSYYGNWSS